MPSAPLDQQQFPCVSCGAKLEFNPLLGDLACPYCGHTEAVPEADQDAPEQAFDKHDLSDSVELARLSEQSLEVACPGCRARVVFEPPDVAGKCPFCGTGLVSQAEPSKPVAKPDGVLPCKVTAKEATTFLRQWLGSNWFLPSDLQKLARSESVQGVYLPYWTFDANTWTTYDGERGERHTTRSHSGTTTTQTHWYPISGEFECFFDDMLVPATKQLPPKRLRQLTDWDLDDVVAYTPSFLAGFKAQRYQVPVQDGWQQAQSDMKAYLEKDAKAAIGGDDQRLNALNTDYSEVTYKHVLLPVWLCVYRYQQQRYQVVVNGQTGQVIGDRPYSKGKIAAAVVAGVAVAGTALLAFSVLAQNMQPIISTEEGTPSRIYRRPTSGLGFPDRSPVYHGAPRKAPTPQKRVRSPFKGSGGAIRHSRTKRR